MIRVVAVFTAFLSGSLLGIVLSNIRARRREVEEQARKVADAFSDTVLVDGVQLPKPDDDRWTPGKRVYLHRDPQYLHIDVQTKSELPVLILGPIVVGGELAYGHDCVSINGKFISKKTTQAEKNYAAAVWRAYHTRTTLKAIR